MGAFLVLLKFVVDILWGTIYILVGYRKGGYFISPKLGRPTTDPKDRFLKIRVSQSDLDKIKYVSKSLKITQTEAIRRGIEIQYNELKDK